MFNQNLTTASSALQGLLQENGLVNSGITRLKTNGGKSRTLDDKASGENTPPLELTKGPILKIFEMVTSPEYASVPPEPPVPSLESAGVAGEDKGNTCHQSKEVKPEIEFPTK
ncbi:hypothetical protein Tco_1463980 [Tanacetum coccineum]